MNIVQELLIVQTETRLQLFLINGSYKIDITINSQNLDSTVNATISSLKIYENVFDVPQAELDLIIQSEFNESNPIVDGSPVDIDIKYTNGKNESYYNRTLRFRVFDFSSSELSNNMINFKLLLVHKSYYGMIARAHGLYQATVSSLFITKANELGLENNNIISTNDAQAWVHSGGSLKEFLDNACLHSLRDSESVMVWFINRYGAMNLIDLSDIMKNDIKWFFVPTVTDEKSLGKNHLVYSSPQYKYDSGINNIYQGYGKTIGYYNVINNSIETDSVRGFFKGSNKININKDCSKYQRFEDMGIDSGNLHSNYFRAAIQNQRGRALYSTHVRVKVDYPKDIRLGDTASYFQNVSKDKQDKCYTGTYFISRLTTDITPSTFINYIELTSQGINAYSTELF